MSSQHARTPAPLVVVMGVSGSGKTTIGARLAHDVGLPFEDADTLHPTANVRKMASGTPLTDEDRWPWLDIVGQRLHGAGASGEGLVMACSALRRSYRDRIRSVAPGTVFIHLHGTVEVLARRLEGRSGHFMPATLLESQLDTLEPLDGDEAGTVLEIDQTSDDIVQQARRTLMEPPPPMV